jgi:hypothetical protein
MGNMKNSEMRAGVQWDGWLSLERWVAYFREMDG